MGKKKPSKPSKPKPRPGYRSKSVEKRERAQRAPQAPEPVSPKRESRVAPAPRRSFNAGQVTGLPPIPHDALTDITVKQRGELKLAVWQYNKIRESLKELTASKEAATENIVMLLELAGVTPDQPVMVDRYRTRLVKTTRSTIVAKTLVELGVGADVIQRATKTTSSVSVRISDTEESGEGVDLG